LVATVKRLIFPYKIAAAFVFDTGEKSAWIRCTVVLIAQPGRQRRRDSQNMICDNIGLTMSPGRAPRASANKCALARVGAVMGGSGIARFCDDARPIACVQRQHLDQGHDALGRAARICGMITNSIVAAS
jgi:hypothetical protein